MQQTYTTSATAPAGSADQRIRQAAAAIQAAQPELSREQAIAHALKANPALYNQYLSENPAQTGRWLCAGAAAMAITSRAIA